MASLRSEIARATPDEFYGNQDIEVLALFTIRATAAPGEAFEELENEDTDHSELNIHADFAGSISHNDVPDPVLRKVFPQLRRKRHPKRRP